MNFYKNIEKKKEIQKILGILKFNNELLFFYNSVKDEGFCDARTNIRKLIGENIDFYKELNSLKNILKNKKTEKVEEKEIKQNKEYVDEDDSYDNTLLDTVREQRQNEYWDNYIFNFSK